MVVYWKLRKRGGYLDVTGVYDKPESVKLVFGNANPQLAYLNCKMYTNLQRPFQNRFGIWEISSISHMFSEKRGYFPPDH